MLVQIHLTSFLLKIDFADMVIFMSSKGQLDRFKEKIQTDTERKQKETLDKQLKVEEEEMNRLITEHKVNILMVCKHIY